MENNLKNNIRIPIEISKKNFHQKLLRMKEQAFQSMALAEVYEVWQEMLKAPKNIIFLGLIGSLSSAGYWSVVCHFIKNRFIDVLVLTGANLSEDIYEAMGNKYYKVDPWFVDDKELLKQKMDRFYDHAADEYDYGKMENILADFSKELNVKLKKPTVFPLRGFFMNWDYGLKRKTSGAFYHTLRIIKSRCFLRRLLTAEADSARRILGHLTEIQKQNASTNRIWDGCLKRVNISFPLVCIL